MSHRKERVLFVCTANMCRSPTGEDILKDEEGYEVKSAGIYRGSPVAVTVGLIRWADVIFAMESFHKRAIVGIDGDASLKVKVLNIPDRYSRDNPELISLLLNKLKVHGIYVGTKNRRALEAEKEGKC